jgi:hypothetical protein
MSNSLYGPRLHAQVSYLKFDLGLTLPKIRKLLRDQYALELSTGPLSGMISRAADNFSSSHEDLKTSRLDQDHLHVDERQDGEGRRLPYGLHLPGVEWLPTSQPRTGSTLEFIFSAHKRRS